jgi:TonB dependent receptor/CarboxypepD_reg-like domain/TonB-dependent Receptor Plug Domain
MNIHFPKYFILFISTYFALCTQAQSKYTISGYVKDSASNETLINANITVTGLSKAVSTNAYGFFSITLNAGEQVLTVSFTGYKTKQYLFNLTKNEEVDILLQSKKSNNEAVVVYAKRRDANVKSAQMGKIELSTERIKALPSFLGEVDILKTIQLLPGVRNAGEGNAGFYVRGGGPDQNLIILDDAVVYNTGHLFGFFSIFNADAIKNTTLIKGGMPAQYGGRLSSVLDVSMKDGNNKKIEVEGGIGAIASRLSIQGPLVKEKASFILSARRTYIDALAKGFVKESSAFFGSGYYFYDLNAKMNYRIDNKNRIYASGYFGKDKFTFRNARQSFKANIPWGNSTATLRWNHVFHSKLFANTSLVYNDYNFEFGASQNDFKVKLASGIRDYTAKIDFDYYPITNHKVKFGASYTYHRFKPSIVSGEQGNTVFNPNNAAIKFGHETGIYIQDDWEVNDKLSINAGLRYSFFQQVGPFTLYKTDVVGNRIDSSVFGKLKKVKAYGGLEPRLTMRYALNDATSIKGSVTRNLQYIHLVSNAGSTLPTDLWVPSTYLVKPQKSWLYALGLFKNFNDNMFETSVEVYYKDMKNQIEYKEGYTPGIGDVENEFTFGRGWSYGSEFFINKARGKWTGWVGYTLSWTWRKFAALNSGNAFPAKYDRRHDLSVVATYEANKKWKFSGVFVYGTGSATTIPERFYIINGVLTQEFSKLNSYRLAAYHRLDFSANYTPQPKKKRKIQTNWAFGIYNVYSRLNPYFIYFDQEGSPYNGTLKVQGKQVSLFPIIPSVTLNFKW